MKSFKLSQGGDLIISDNELIMTQSNIEELKQSVWLTLSTNLNEWFLNTKFGLNYDIFMDNRTVNIDYIKTEIEKAILLDKRVIRVEKIDIRFNKINRRITVDVFIRDYNENLIEIREVIKVG